MRAGTIPRPILTLVLGTSQTALEDVSKRPPRESTYTGLVPNISAGLLYTRLTTKENNVSKPVICKPRRRS